MESFIGLYYGTNHTFTDSVVLDGVGGHLVISGNVVSFSWIDVNYTDSKRTVKIQFHNCDDFRDGLVKILGLRFWRDRVFTDEAGFHLQKAFSEMMREVQNREEDVCYVCLEGAREYKTSCGHAICYACFVKSQKYTDIDGDDFYEFVCGICRRKKIKYCP